MLMLSKHAFGLLVGLALLSGCSGIARRTIDLDAGQAPASAMRVENSRGSVLVEVDPGAGAGRIEAVLRVDRLRARAEQEAIIAGMTVEAQVVDGVLGVRASSPHEGAWVELRIIVASGSAFDIINAGGKVTLVDVAGRVEVENDGEIEVRMRGAARDAITLRSQEGLVRLVLPEGSRGSFTLTSEQGRSFFTAHGGSLRDVHLRGEQDWTGILGDGDNAVVLASQRGDVAVFVEGR